MRRYVLLAVLFFPVLSFADRSVRVDGVVENVVKFEPFLLYQHLSDIMRGPPFFAYEEGETEPTTDYLAFGVTMRWRKLELDLSHGRKARDCDYGNSCPTESGTQISFRVYPWRKR